MKNEKLKEIILNYDFRKEHAKKGRPYAEKHLESYEVAKDKLSDTHLILIDDTDFLTDDGGKDKLLSPRLIEDGYIPLFNGRQTLFLKWKQ